MKQQVNPVVVGISITAFVAIVALVLWLGLKGSSPVANQGLDAAQKDAIRKSAIDIPAATGAAPGMTAPPVKSGGVSTPMMGGGGMTAPNNGR